MKIIKTKSPLWMGNGMGTESAEYQAMNGNSIVAYIYNTGYQEWVVRVVGKGGKYFQYFKDAKVYALSL